MIIDNKDYLKYGPSDNEEEEWLSDWFKYTYNLMRFNELNIIVKQSLRTK